MSTTKKAADRQFHGWPDRESEMAEADRQFYGWPVVAKHMTDNQLRVYMRGAGHSQWLALRNEQLRRARSEKSG